MLLTNKIYEGNLFMRYSKHLTYAERMFLRARLNRVRHITLDPDGPGVVRIHLVPCHKPDRETPFTAILNGQDILPLNPYSRPGTPLETIDGVVVHYVGNPGTSAAANRSFFANLALTHETYASAHFVVGLEGEVIQCVPLSEVAYCSSQANSHTVSIEVCHADETGEFSAETMASLLRLTAWLCEEFDLAPANVIRHYDVTGKVCPKYYVDHPEAWEDFRSALRAARTQENPS